MAGEFELEKILADMEHIDVKSLCASLPSQEQIEEAVAKELCRRSCADFCSKVKAVLANDGNGKTIDEIVELINEYSKARL